PLDAAHRIPLRRAPDVHQACLEAYGPAEEPSVASLRELLGLIGAHEWRKHGIKIPALGARIHPHYGVFTPVRHEYADLVASAPIPSRDLAFDIGTGTACSRQSLRAGRSGASSPPISTRGPSPAPAKTWTGWASVPRSRRSSPTFSRKAARR